MFNLIIALPGGTRIVKGLSMFLLKILVLVAYSLAIILYLLPYNVVKDFTLHILS